jgi:hypothetical protein
MNKTKALLTLAAIAILALTLGGCSAAAAIANAQSKVQACTSIDKTFLAVGAGITNETSELSTNPKAAAAKITTYSDQLTAAAAKLTNTQIKKTAQTAASALSLFAKDLTDYAAAPTSAKLTKFQAATAQLQPTFVAVDTACKF